MRKILWALLCFLSTTRIYGQSAKSAVDAFRDSLVNQQLVLRNFSGEDRVRASWTGAAIELDPPRWQTLGVLVADSVKMKGQMLTLECIRHVAVRDKNDRVVLYSTPSTVEVDVDLRGSDPAAALPHLKEALFYLSTQDALAAIPTDLQSVIPARIDKSVSHPTDSSGTLKPVCDCVDRDKPECAATQRPTDGLVPPRYLRGRDPEFSDQARRARLTGHVDVRFKVDEKGHPTELWVAAPLGLGLDEEAANAVLTYEFRPAMCHDKPVSVYMKVDVRFQPN